MNHKRTFYLVILVAVLTTVVVAAVTLAQQTVYKAPAPADWAALAKLPDFSGVWERSGVGGGGNPVFGTAPNAPRGNPPQPAVRGTGGAARGGRGSAAAEPSFTPQYQAMRDAAAKAPEPEDNTTANCLPPGMPRIMGQPYPMEFLLTPGKVTIVIEAYTQVRHIYTDGRRLPEDPDAKFFGTSVGRWEGDTLIVETIGFSDHVQLARGVPHSDKMKIVERFRLIDPDTMTIETTVTDPGVLAAPYTTTNTLRRHRNWTISEYICEENNRNYVDQSGKAGINLTPPAARKKD